MQHLSNSSWMMVSGDSDSTGFNRVVNSHTPPINVLTQHINGGHDAQAMPDSTVPLRASPAEVADKFQSDAVEIDHAKASPAKKPAPRTQGSPSNVRTDEKTNGRELEIV
jgi:hypothetical protein